MRLPGRHDQPVTPLEMTEADTVEFARQISTGFDGRAQWRRNCSCGHRAGQHREGQCTKCTCRQLTYAQHEELVIWLHPDAANYLPPDVYVIAHGNTYEPIGPDGRGGTLMGVQFLLGRDYDSGTLKVVRSGVREETTVYTDQPEGGDDDTHHAA